MGTELVGMRGHSRKAVRMVCAQGWGSRGRPRNCNSPSSWSSVGEKGGGRLGCGLGGARVKSSCPRVRNPELRVDGQVLGRVTKCQIIGMVVLPAAEGTDKRRAGPVCWPRACGLQFHSLTFLSSTRHCRGWPQRLRFLFSRQLVSLRVCPLGSPDEWLAGGRKKGHCSPTSSAGRWRLSVASWLWCLRGPSFCCKGLCALLAALLPT